MPAIESLYTYEGTSTFITCPSCDSKSKVFTPEKLVVYACPHCALVIHHRDIDKYKKLKNSKLGFLKYFPIGTRGEYQGEIYTVVGNAYKVNKKNQYDRWEEILLVDSAGQFSFLNCSYGNYVWLKQVNDLDPYLFLDPDDKKAVYRDELYRMFQSYKYNTQYFRGEFHYDVVDVSGLECMDFIAPPHLVSIEKISHGKYETFYGKHFSRKQLAKIFNNDLIREQNSEGIGIAQPVMGGVNWRTFTIGMAVTALIMLVIGIGISQTKSDRNIVHETYICPFDSVKTPEFVSKSFYIDSSTFNNYIEFKSFTSLDNEWIEIAISLINETTGEERECGLISEYYSGVDNGYSWHEGSNDGQVNLSGVPGGKYHLKCKIYSSITNARTVSLDANYGSNGTWNFLILVLSWGILIVILRLIKRRYELMRTGEIDSFFEAT